MCTALSLYVAPKSVEECFPCESLSAPCTTLALCEPSNSIKKRKRMSELSKKVSSEYSVAVYTPPKHRPLKPRVPPFSSRSEDHCPACGRDFSSPATLIKHLGVCKGLPSVFTPESEERHRNVNESPPTLKADNVNTANDGRVECPFCMKLFAHMKSLKWHIFKFHPENHPTNKQTALETKDKSIPYRLTYDQNESSQSTPAKSINGSRVFQSGSDFMATLSRQQLDDTFLVFLKENNTNSYAWTPTLKKLFPELNDASKVVRKEFKSLLKDCFDKDRNSGRKFIPSSSTVSAPSKRRKVVVETKTVIVSRTYKTPVLNSEGELVANPSQSDSVVALTAKAKRLSSCFHRPTPTLQERRMVLASVSDEDTPLSCLKQLVDSATPLLLSHTPPVSLSPSPPQLTPAQLLALDLDLPDSKYTTRSSGGIARHYNMFDGYAPTPPVDGRENVLLLGMEYVKAAYYAIVTDPRAQAKRDYIRLHSLEAKLNKNVYTLSLDAAADRRGQWVRHLPANFNAETCVEQIRILWPGVRFSWIIADYFRTPSSWAATRWSHAFYSKTIPAFRQVLLKDGRIVLPNYHNDEINCTLNRIKEHEVEKHGFDLRFMEASENPLYVATGLAEAELESELHGSEYINETQLYSSNLNSMFPFLSLRCINTKEHARKSAPLNQAITPDANSLSTASDSNSITKINADPPLAVPSSDSIARTDSDPPVLDPPPATFGSGQASDLDHSVRTHLEPASDSDLLTALDSIAGVSPDPLYEAFDLDFISSTDLDPLSIAFGLNSFLRTDLDSVTRTNVDPMSAAFSWDSVARTELDSVTTDLDLPSAFGSDPIMGEARIDPGSHTGFGPSPISALSSNSVISTAEIIVETDAGFGAKRFKLADSTFVAIPLDVTKLRLPPPLPSPPPQNIPRKRLNVLF